MKRTLVMAFGDFLEFDYNSSEAFLKKLPARSHIIKRIVPVGYFKKDFLKPIKKYHPDRIVFLGMAKGIPRPKIESCAKNEKVTAKNKTIRVFISIYSSLLKLFGKNFRIKKPIPKEKLAVIPIDKNKPSSIKLHSRIPLFEYIDKSEDAGHFVCNYAIWVVEEFLQKKHPDIDFYFIHVPEKMTLVQENELRGFILS